MFKKLTQFILAASILLLSFDNILFSNALALKKELEEQETLSIFTRIIDRIEQTDGYEVGKTNVCLLAI